MDASAQPSPASYASRPAPDCIGEVQRENAALQACVHQARNAGARVRDVLAGSRLGTWDPHLASKTVLLSPTCEAVHGMPPQSDYHRDSFIGAIDPDDLGPCTVAVRAAVQGTSDLETSYRLERPDGEVR